MPHAMKTTVPRFLLLILTALSPCLVVSQDVVDIGIFENPESTVFTVKARPTFTISGQAVTNVQLTIRWEQTSGVTSLAWLGTTVGLVPQGEAIQAGGYNYQVYASTGGGNLNWNAGTEYTILTVAPDNQDFNCARFEIALDDWTSANNGDYYFEVVGEDRTGIRYEPSVNYGSEGGYVDGDTSIYLGAGTGLLTLENYNGIVLTWQRNASQSGWVDIQNTAGLGSYEEIPSPDGVYQYRARVQLGDCPPSNSVPATVVVELLAVWTGAEDTLWENFGNWNAVGVPDSFTDALVPQVTANRYPSIAGQAFTKKFTVRAGASLIIGPAGELTIANDMVNDGLIRILSDAGSSGSLLNTGTVEGAGDFIFEMFTDPLQDHLISVPVAGATVGPLAAGQLWEWMEPQATWLELNDPFYMPGALKGFRIFTTGAPQTVTWLGDAFHSGIYSLPLTNNGAQNGRAGGFNLAGNPYPSAINWNSAEGWVLNQVDPCLYVYNGDAGNFGTFIRGDAESTTLGVDSILGAGQGFFVHVNHEFTVGEVAVNNAARLHDHGKILKTAIRSDEPQIRIGTGMGPVQEGLRDEVLVRFRETASQGFDEDCDAYDLAGMGDAPQLFTRGADTLRLAVNTYPPLTENVNVAMGFVPFQSGNFYFKVTEMTGFGPDTLVFLEDLKLDLIHRLQEGTELSVPGTPGDDINRFILHFYTDPVELPEQEYANEPIVLVRDGQFHIYSPDEELMQHIFIIDLTGRVITDQTIQTSHYSVGFDQPPGIYFLLVTRGEERITLKFINN